MKKMSRSDKKFWRDYGIDPGVPDSGGMTTEQLGEAMMRTVQQMSPDEKAIFRARLDRSLGLVKTSGGKSS